MKANIKLKILGNIKDAIAAYQKPSLMLCFVCGRIFKDVAPLLNSSLDVKMALNIYL